MGETGRPVLKSFQNLAVVAALVSGLIVATVPDAGATAPTQITFTQEGCRNDGSIALPDGNGDFICPDLAYTTGNLGKGWNELDLVPLRATVEAGNSAPATQTYTFAVAADSLNGGIPGFDVISVPVLNTTLSSPGCTAPTVGAQQTTGTTNQTISRLVTVTQAKNTTCVYDYYARLALGSHSFPGSSLSANLFNENLDASGIGQKKVSIPSNEIAAQGLSKDMSANQDSDHIWNLTKSATPASLSFTNTCDPSVSRQQSVAITVSWTKQPATASGAINVITHVYATNPAARVITLNQLSDQIYSGTTAIGSAVTAGPIDLAANTANILVLTHQTTVPSGTTALNDIATATYTDKVTGVAIPGTSTATASATVQPGNELNATAAISDLESITGTGLTFSVDSTTGASGSFGGGYTAGTPTTGPVSWTSSTQSSSGSVTFNKTVYATAATVTSGSLSDNAALNGSDGYTTQAPLSVGLSTAATTSLTVTKDSTLALASNKTYTFHLFNGADVDQSKSTTVTLPAGSTGPVTSAAITGLSPTATYYVKEDASAPFGAQTSSPVTFSLVAGDASTCAANIGVTNTAAPATAQVRKITNPTSSGSWTFTLTGPNSLSETLNATANGAYAQFASALDVDGGTYTITETPQAGYDLTSVTGDVNGDAVTTSVASRTCSFTLDLSKYSGKAFECTFTNTQRGTIIVKKVTSPSGASGSFSFTGDVSGSIGDGQTLSTTNLVPGTYTSTESDPTPGFDLTGISCNDSNSTGTVGTRTATFRLDPGETVTCTFTNSQRGHIIIKKVTDPAGSTLSFEYDPSYSATNFFLSDQQTSDSGAIAPGTYAVAEVNIPSGWDLTGSSCSDGSSVSSISLQAGETVTCTFNNRQRGHAKVVKTVSGAALTGSQAYTFQLRSGASASSAGSILETLTANAANGGVIPFATNLVPGTTYQLCEQMQPGWLTSLGPPFFSVYNPSGDNSVVCTDFTVSAGQLKTFNIDNTPPPGGLALTIGYWKNWSSCSGGKQAPTLDRTLLAAANAGHPITLGLLVLDPNALGATTACKYAVNVLNKSTIDGKSKKSSDPLFNMAAQLLAADLNVQGGAGTCPAAMSAINQAHALLSKYSWNGNSYSPKLTSADANLANQLAANLDKYNNNKLC